MTEPDLFDDMAADSKVDNTSLDTELTRIPYLHAKWMRRYVALTRDLRKAELEMARMKLARSNYYMGLSSDEEYREFPLNRKVLKTELADTLAADSFYAEAVERAEILREVTLAVEKFISSLNSRGFSLGKAVDYVRWKNGG